jgi:hypothetical protein
VLLGKVALQAVVVTLLANLEMHRFLMHSLWGERPWNGGQAFT